MPHKNVLLLIADDWSPIAGCYGNDVIKMPNVDALAARGTLFQHAFCTTPSCAASRANLLTGHYSHTHGQYGHSHSIHNFHTQESMPSIPKQLQSAGFKTGVVGKLHVQPASVYPWDYEAGGGRNVKQIADNITKFFDETDSDQPFYLHVGYPDPHRDFGNQQTYEGVPETTYSPDEVLVPDFLPDHPDVRQEFAEYYQAITRLDTGIGMAVQALQDAGRADDTLIIIMSDHGMPFPGGKASSFDTGHNCPLIIVRPNADAVVSDALVNWSNIAPTVFEWCGINAPEGLPEKSLVPILDETNPEGFDETFFSHTFHEVTNYYPYRVLRGRKYKFVRNLYPGITTPLPSDLWASPTWQAIKNENLEMGKRQTEKFLHQDAEALFDIENDPMETTNIIDDPAIKDIAEEMRQKVRDFRMATYDPWCLASYHEGEPGIQPVRR